MDTLEDRLILAGRIARSMTELYLDTDENPEYYRGMQELGACLIGGDSDVAFHLIDVVVDLAKSTEH